MMTLDEKNKGKIVLITGITGQAGSFLADMFLKKDLEVHGFIRRNSTSNNEKNIEHIKDKIYLHYGDMTDSVSLNEIIREVVPHFVFNCAAMSHVGASFTIPESTVDVDGVGVLRILEAIRKYSPATRFLQFSTSELFGKVQRIPQTESTAFYPRSPYGCAKLFGYWITKNYRESYKIFASNAIFFNMECISPKNVITIRKNGIIKICYVEDLKKQHGESPTQIYNFSEKNIEIMTSEGFKLLKTVSIKKKTQINDPVMREIKTRNGFIQVTNEHNCFLSKKEKIKAMDVKENMTLQTCTFKENLVPTNVSDELAMFLGYMVADGSIYKGKSNYFQGRYTKNNDELRKKVAESFFRLFGGDVTEAISASGFKKGGKVKYINFNGISQGCFQYIHDLIYHSDGNKKVPEIILSSSVRTMQLFFTAYYEGDGLKKGKCNRPYQCFGTISPILAQGLFFICSLLFSDEELMFHIRKKNSHSDKPIYLININDKQTLKGRHLLKDKKSVMSNIEIEQEKWVYDLEVENGEYQLGIGNIVVKNSSRRSKDFVTQKIVQGLIDVLEQKKPYIELGNLGAKRDWGYCPDYMEGAYKILCHDRPDDFLLATNETHTVGEFVEETARILWPDKKMEWRGNGVDEKLFLSSTHNLPIVKINPKFYRPAEVDLLIGDYSKAKIVLGWQPKVRFKELVKIMVDAELEKRKK